MATVRKEERLLLIADGQGDGTSSSDDARTTPTVSVLAIYGRPQVKRIGTNAQSAPYNRTCNACNALDPLGTCEAAHCLKALSPLFNLPRTDMRTSTDAKGSGHKRDWQCFRCNVAGHFARDCPQRTAQEKAVQPMVANTQLAIAAMKAKRIDNKRKADDRGDKRQGVQQRDAEVGGTLAGRQSEPSERSGVGVRGRRPGLEPRYLVGGPP
jgi:hypothetical protein